MSSDPIKLVTERRFHELRQEARGGQLIQATRTTAPRRPRPALATLRDVISWVTGRRRRTPAITGRPTGHDDRVERQAFCGARDAAALEDSRS